MPNFDDTALLGLVHSLCHEVEQLRARLAVTRVDHANLAAAVRACLGAYDDNEPDPFYYLRDELSPLDAWSAR